MKMKSVMTSMRNGVMVLSTFLPSRLRVVLFRLLGFDIGKRVTISPMSLIVADEIALGDYACIKPLTLIRVHRLEMGRYSIIASLSVIFGESSLRLSDRARVGHANLLDCTESIHLGDYCGLGPRNTLYTHASWLPITLGYPNNRRPIKLGAYVWTGINVTILPGATTGDHVFVHANLVLSGRVEGRRRITAKGCAPIEKMRKPMDLEAATNRMVEAVSEKLSVLHPGDDGRETPLSEVDVVIVSSLDERAAIERAKKHGVQVLVFARESVDDETGMKMDRLALDWYDFETLTMSAMRHPHKSIVMKQLVSLGGLRFLERERTRASIE